MFRPDRRAVLLAASLAVALAAPLAARSDFPSKPVSLIVPNPPGGVVDTSARLVSEPLAKGPRPAGGGRQPARRQRQHRLRAGGAARPRTATRCSCRTRLTTSPTDDDGAAAVGAEGPGAGGLLTTATNVIAVHPSVPAGNLREFIAYSRPIRAGCNFASQGNGSLSHIGTALFEQVTQTDMQHVPYKGSGAAIQDVLAGNVQVFITTPPVGDGPTCRRQLKALAITAKSRFPQLPSVPTTAEAACPASSWRRGWACSRRPGRRPTWSPSSRPRSSARWKRPRRAARGRRRHRDPPRGPGELAARVARETDYWGRLIRARNITAD
jgi:hypothetical protein